MWCPRRLYGDEALDNALNTFVKLLLSIPQTDLLDYPKLSQTYYVLLECLAQDHMAFLATLEPQVGSTSSWACGVIYH